MGDRGNIVVLMDSDDEGVFLYTHWRGSEIGQVLQTALAKNWRWDDPSYLARIIFDVLVPEHEGETGYGIATWPPDNEHPYLVVDCRLGEVHVAERDALANGRLPFRSYLCSISFQGFVDMDSETIQEWANGGYIVSQEGAVPIDSESSG